MKLNKLFSFLLFFLSSINFLVYAQAYGNGSSGNVTISTSNQIINIYSSVTYILCPFIGLSSPVSVINGERFLIIQMEGPTAGTWEWLRASFLTGSSVYFTTSIPPI